MTLGPTDTLKLDALRRDNPWPEFDYSCHEPFYLPLDGGGTGGRELIYEAIREYNVDLMVEIGCFLCGSTLQWLRNHDHLTVVGVDPWDQNWALYVELLVGTPQRMPTVAHLSSEELTRIVRNIREFGNFCIALNNVRSYRNRFIPVRRRSPEALQYLHARRIKPQLVYIDAAKVRADLDEVIRLFPEAVLCGDDWLWPDETGALRMQNEVKQFASQHDLEIRSRRQSWLLVPRRRSELSSVRRSESSSEMPATLEKITHWMEKRANTRGALGKSMKFSTDQGTIYIDGRHTPPKVSNEDKSADCVVRVKFADLAAMIEGTLDGMTAYTAGRLTIEGEVGLFLKLRDRVA